MNADRLWLVVWLPRSLLAVRHNSVAFTVFVLIDDASDPRLGSQFNDIKSVITA